MSFQVRSHYDPFEEGGCAEVQDKLVELARIQMLQMKIDDMSKNSTEDAERIIRDFSEMEVNEANQAVNNLSNWSQTATSQSPFYLRPKSLISSPSHFFL